MKPEPLPDPENGSDGARLAAVCMARDGAPGIGTGREPPARGADGRAEGCRRWRRGVGNAGPGKVYITPGHCAKERCSIVFLRKTCVVRENV